ncbi:MAG: metallophosphoesterase [Candidatus Heimdallarchaeaceae archaeon]
MKIWISKDEKLLIGKWANWTKQNAIDAFPNRTYKSIERKANSLNLKKSKLWKENYISSLKTTEVDNLKKKEKIKMQEKYGGKDRLVGRPIRLNVVTIEPTREDPILGRYATVKFTGDFHWGSMACDEKMVKMTLDFCLDNSIPMLLMGDLIDTGLKSSVGASMYQQSIHPQEQLDEMIALLKPLADAGLILGIHKGNHEARVEKDTGIDISKVICNQLGVRYLGSAIWSLFRVGHQNYKIYSMHGSTGSRYIYTKLKAITDISHNFDADVIAMGHVHEKAEAIQEVQTLDLKRKAIRVRKKYLIITGHFLNYDNSYAQDKGYPIGKKGSVNVKFFADRFDIHTST